MNLFVTQRKTTWCWSRAIGLNLQGHYKDNRTNSNLPIKILFPQAWFARMFASIWTRSQEWRRKCSTRGTIRTSDEHVYMIQKPSSFLDNTFEKRLILPSNRSFMHITSKGIIHADFPRQMNDIETTKYTHRCSDNHEKLLVYSPTFIIKVLHSMCVLLDTFSKFVVRSRTPIVMESSLIVWSRFSLANLAASTMSRKRYNRQGKIELFSFGWWSCELLDNGFDWCDLLMSIMTWCC